MTSASPVPRASMVVLAFNQQDFIEQAIRSAFAQDYPNLEILISDDGSSDRTAEIIRRLVNEYDGPHEVRINQRPKPNGILDHIYDAVGKTTGQWIVGQAGDDLSYPHRVSEIVRAFQESGADAVWSSFDKIDAKGALIERNAQPRPEFEIGRFFRDWKPVQLTGATSAYVRRLFAAVRCPDQPIMAEDYFFSLILGLRRRLVRFIDEPLVAYRVHGQSLTSSYSDLLGVEEYERRVAKTARWGTEIFRLLEDYSADASLIDPSWGSPAELDMTRIRQHRAFLDYVARWMEASPAARISALLRFRDRKQIRWLLPRTFGLNGLVALKRLRSAARA